MFGNILSYSGNVGKTTIYECCLQLWSAIGHEIEGQNAGGVGNSESVIEAKRFKALAAKISMYPPDQNVLLDTGSSSIKDMFKHFDELEDFAQLIDFWIIPVTKHEKVIVDTIATVGKLVDLGIDSSKIVMIINNVEDIDMVEDDFQAIFKLREHGVFVADEVVLQNEIYGLAKKKKQTVFDLANADFDFQKQKAAALKEGNEALIKALGEKNIMRQSARRAVKNMTAVFQSTPLYQPVAVAVAVTD